MDGTGKSTLIYALADKLEGLVLKSHNKHPSIMDIHHVHSYARAFSRPVIMDRHHVISDYIYGRVLRGQSAATTEYAKLLRNDFFLVYCRPPAPVLSAPQMDGVVDHSQELQEAYDKLMEKLQPDFTFDFNQHTMEQVYERLQNL